MSTRFTGTFATGFRIVDLWRARRRVLQNYSILAREASQMQVRGDYATGLVLSVLRVVEHNFATIDKIASELQSTHQQISTRIWREACGVLSPGFSPLRPSQEENRK